MLACSTESRVGRDSTPVSGKRGTSRYPRTRGRRAEVMVFGESRHDREALAVFVRGIVPVQEIEAWWMAYPSALAKVHEKWQEGTRRTSGDTETVKNPKERLQRLTRRSARDSSGQYKESDSRRIAEEIVKVDGWQRQVPPSLGRAIQAIGEVGRPSV